MRAHLACWLVISLVACGGEAGPTGPQGPQGPEGPQGPPGPGPTPSISAVDPLSIFMEHEAVVLISGSATSWDASTSVDFGSGVSVGSVVVASPSAIFATITADSTTAIGTTDITVTDAVGSATFANAFGVLAPLQIFDTVGTFTPGALMAYRVRQLDEETPFESVLQVYLAETGQLGTILTRSLTTLQVQFFFPLNEPPGPRTLVVRSLHSGETVTSRGEPVNLPAPTVLPLPLATPTNVQIDEEEGTRVFQIDAPAGSLVEVTTSSVIPTPTFPPQQLFINPDSSFESGAADSYLAADGSSWFVAVKAPPGGPYTLDVTATASAATITPVVSSPVPGDISVAGESDFYSIAVTSGQAIDVAIQDGATDTCAGGTIQALVELLAPDGSGLWIDGLGCPSFGVGPVDVTGTYYVRVRAGVGNPDTFDYELDVKAN